MDPVEFERLSYPAETSQSSRVRDDLRSWLAAVQVRAEVAQGLLAATSEAVDNVVAHAYRGPDRSGATVDLTMMVDGADLVVSVADHGHWVEPASTDLEHDATGRPARHGRGIILMNNHVDEVAIHHDHLGTTVLLRSRR